jgi:hypothetical protein
MIKILCALLLILSVFAFETKIFSQDAQKATIAFWTAENLKRAVPVESLISDKFSLFTKLPESIEKSFQDKDSLKADTEFVRPESLYSQHPYKTTGKLFFKFQGRPAYCSGSASGNNAVLTAGHCVWLQGNFHTDLLFVPQFNNGSRPVGQFVGTESLLFEEWKDGNFARDVAFVVVGKHNEKSLEETVGKMPIGVCDVKENIVALGYPGLPEPYNGEKLVRTIGDIQRRFPFSPWEPAPIQIRSKQGPGSSGGPWIMKFQNPTTGAESNLACSVNSFGVRFTFYVFGPFFDAKVLEMHKIAIEK